MLSESIKHGSVVDAVVVAAEVCERFTFFIYYSWFSFDECVTPTVC